MRQAASRRHRQCLPRREPLTADEPSFRTVNLQADGLALSPREYVALLGKLVQERAPQPDYYSNGGAVEELERKFALLRGKQAAIFLPTGTLANHQIALVTESAERFEDEYARAWKSAGELIRLFESDPRFKVRKVANGTSRFFLTAAGTAATDLSERLSQKSVVLPHPQPDTGMIPVQVNPTLLRTTPAELSRTFVSSL